MQTWREAGTGHDPGENGRELVLAVLAGWLRRRGGVVHGAWGTVAPEAEATVSGSTRIVLGIAGRNAMRIPQGEAVRQILLRAGDAVVVDRRAWNRPLHLHAKVFCTLDLKPDWQRVYLRRTSGPGSLPAQHATSILRGPPHPALRSAADAAEALAPLAEPDLAWQAVMLAAALTSRALAAPDGGVDDAWSRVRDWIEEHLHDGGIGRDQAAAAAGMHPGHLSRILTARTGQGFAAWVSARRVERARDLLLATELPVAAIGQRCGFASPAYFSHAFRAGTGMSPGAWRQNRRAAGG